MMKTLLLLSYLFTAFVDWPQFRGPEANGHATNVNTPLQWSDTENVAWKVAIPGLGWSSPVVVDGQIYLTTAVTTATEPAQEQLSLRALALDASTGKVLWDRELRRLDEVPAIHAKNSHASPTPIVHEGHVYVHFGTWGTYSLATSDGSLEWSCHELVYTPVHGNGGSPVLADNKLVIICDGSSNPYVAAIDASTGKLAWKTERSIKPSISHSFGTVAVADVEGKQQVLAPGPGHFAAYDLGTGEEIWRIVEPGWSVVPQPIVTNGLVIYNHDYDHPELIAARLGGSGDMTDTNVVWRMKRQAPSTPTPVLVGDDLFFVSDDGIASCIDAMTGETHWTARAKGNYSASLVYANEHILMINEDGLATWIKPQRTFEVVATCELPGRTFATPAFVDQAMYLRTDGFLYKITAALEDR